MKFKAHLDWRDFYIGAHWESGRNMLFIAPLPFVVLTFQWKQSDPYDEEVVAKAAATLGKILQDQPIPTTNRKLARDDGSVLTLPCFIERALRSGEDVIPVALQVQARRELVHLLRVETEVMNERKAQKTPGLPYVPGELD